MSVRLTTEIRFPAHVRALQRPVLARVLTVTSALLLVALTASSAWAVSTRDLIELSKAGLGDDVLVALIEADGTIFNLDGPKILQLRAEGVSERVITAMIRNATHPAPGPSSTAAPAQAEPRPAPLAPTEQDGAPYFVVIGEKQPPPPPQPPTYYVPWIPAWGVTAGHRTRPAQPTTGYRGFGRFINDGWVDNTRR